MSLFGTRQDDAPRGGRRLLVALLVAPPTALHLREELASLGRLLSNGGRYRRGRGSHGCGRARVRRRRRAITVGVGILSLIQQHF